MKGELPRISSSRGGQRTRRGCAGSNPRARPGPAWAERRLLSSMWSYTKPACKRASRARSKRDRLLHCVVVMANGLSDHRMLSTQPRPALWLEQRADEVVW